MQSNHLVNTRKLLADTKFFDAYSRFDDKKNRYESWAEAVNRVMGMHALKYSKNLMISPELSDLMHEAGEAYKEKLVLGAQRALQFGGEQILKNNMKLYNCTSTYIDRARAFGEIFWALLSGSGVGFSVQKHHVAKLPAIQERKKQPKTFVIEDDIEGWADSLLVLLSSFFVGGGTHPDYEGRRVYFDKHKIREKNAFISGGFKAPGPEPLIKALDKIEHMLQGLVLKGIYKLEPIHVYDIIMHVSDAVLSGGVRRSATICLFSPNDNEMMNAKTGNWFIDNPQRARSNNSVVLIRDLTTREQFTEIMKRTKEFGEPGFAFFDSTEFATNPCFEIGMYPFDFEAFL
jgi:ribonucleoside-diphosphate reductase alpha chain